MAETKTTIRLATDGAAQVRNDFASIGIAGTTAMADIAAATNAAAAASDRYSQRQLDSFARQAAAAKIAAANERSRGAFDDLLGVHAPDTTAAKAAYDVFAKLKPALVDLEDEGGKVNTVLGLNRAQFITAQSAGLRFLDTIIAGRSPLTAFALEAHKLPEVLAEGDGGIAGALPKVTALLTPFNVGLGVAAVATAAAAYALYSYESAQEKLAAVSKVSGAAIGATAPMLEANAIAAASMGRITVGAARDIETSFVQMGGVQAEALARATAVTGDFAAATGTDAKAAVAELGKALQEPIKGAETLAARYGTFTQAEIDNIRALVNANDLLGAQQALLDGVATQANHAAENVTVLGKVWGFLKSAVSVDLADNEGALDRLFGGGTKAEQRLVMLQSLLKHNEGNPLVSDAQLDALKKAIAAAKADVDAQPKNVASRNNQDAQGAKAVTEQYTGAGVRDEQQTRLNALNKLMADGVPLTKEQAEARDALTRAIATFIPVADKARAIAEADARIAAAKTPAEKAAAAAAKERIELAGKEVSTADAKATIDAKGAAAAATAAKSGESHAETLAREAAAMGVAASGALALARAYLAGGSAVVEAEARAKGATDATKKGIDEEAQTRRQLVLDIANGAKAGGMAVNALRAENDARAKVNALVASGALTVEGANEQLKDESILRPLLILQAAAQGDELKTLTRVIAAYRLELARAHDEEKQSATDKIVEDAKNTIAGLHDTAQFAGDHSDAAAVEIARRAAARAAAADRLPADQTAARVGSAVTVEQAKVDTDHVKALAGMAEQQNDALDYARAELATAGLSLDARTAILDRLKEEQTLRKDGIPLDSEQAKADLARVAALDAANAKLKLVQSSLAEFDELGSKVIDDVFNPSNWNNWGSLGKTILHEIEMEFIKLAAIDPIKNLLGIGGGDLPTLGSVFSSLFGSTPHNDAGTDYFSGGATWIGENGPEKVTLPRGSRIDNASATRRDAARSGGGDTHYWDLRGAVVTEDLFRQFQSMADGAAIRGAAGGAAISAANLAQRQRRSLV